MIQPFHAAAVPGHDAEVLTALLAAVARGDEPLADDGWTALVSPPLPASLKDAARTWMMAERARPLTGDTPAHVAAVRAHMVRLDLDALLVPLWAPGRSEAVPPHRQRLAWLTGFAGSAGQAVVTAHRAALFVDGRYQLAARARMDPDLWDIRHLVTDSVAAWLREALLPGQRVGVHEGSHGAAGLEALDKALAAGGLVLAPRPEHPLDAVWSDRPPAPLSRGFLLPDAVAGQSAADKRAGVAESVTKAGADLTVLEAPESVAWLLNLRGRDVPYTPLLLARALVRADGSVALFADPRALDDGVRAALGPDVTVEPPAAFFPALATVGRGRVLLNRQTTSAAAVARLREGGAEIVDGADPCVAPRARKTAAEVAHARDAHRRDGVALVRFLHQMEGPQAPVDERAVGETLLALRGEDGAFHGPSFGTIAGAGANGAIVHYQATADSNRPLAGAAVLLVDSGGQYPGATTDVTRTLALDTPDEALRADYTRVLQAHIALAGLRFPARATGAQLDGIARAPLWRAGVTYDHGTGHGVGAFLAVHEGPQGLSATVTETLAPGMIVSIEPGLYREGRYGIRLENLAVVQSGFDDFLAFETLTLCPFDRTLIAPALLSAAERAWVDAYHAVVAARLGPSLPAADRAWLEAVTRPL